METGRITVLIMAAGTGGHVIPALSIANALQEQGIDVQWLGTPNGLENKLLADTGIPLHQVSVKGLRGAGVTRLLTAPFMILQAFWQSLSVIRKVKPACVVGMGGFVCGPAGVASKLAGVPLLIHEQNAVAGLTNRLLSSLANKICEAFPGTFAEKPNVVFTGNPVRKEIAAVQRSASAGEALKILILGGSLGARAINQLIPALLAELARSMSLQTWHQSGARQFDATVSEYAKQGIELNDEHRLTPFIDDMAAAYSWADLVICRSGASTVSEVAAAGLPAIFIPYPYHKDNQQTLNANWLAEKNAADVLQQDNLSVETLSVLVKSYADDPEKLITRGKQARAMAVFDADSRIAALCREVANA